MPAPLLIQGETFYLDVHSSQFESCLADIASCATRIDTREHIIAFRLDSRALELSSKAGMKASDVLSMLKRYSAFEIPDSVQFLISDAMKDFT